MHTPPPRRSLLRVGQKKQSAPEVMEALEAGEADLDFDFDDEESDVDWDTGEDLEVMEETLGGLYDESQMGLDAAVMDDVTGEVGFNERFGQKITERTMGLGGTPVSAQPRRSAPKQLKPVGDVVPVHDPADEVTEVAPPPNPEAAPGGAAKAIPWMLALGGISVVSIALLFLAVGVGLISRASLTSEPEAVVVEPLPAPVVEAPVEVVKEPVLEEPDEEEVVEEAAVPGPVRARPPSPQPVVVPEEQVVEEPVVEEVLPEVDMPEPVGEQGPSTDLKGKKGLFKKKK